MKRDGEHERIGGCWLRMHEEKGSWGEWLGMLLVTDC